MHSANVQKLEKTLTASKPFAPQTDFQINSHWAIQT